jgi:hypothetical protein
MDNKILETLRKLLALGGKDSGATIHEAEAAMSRAKKIMLEHDLNMSDLEVTELKNDEVGENSESYTSIQGFFKWERTLWRAVDSLFSVAHYTNEKYIPYEERRDRSSQYHTTRFHLHFYGSRGDAVLAAEVTKILRATVIRMGNQQSLDKTSYRQGLCMALLHRAEAMEEKETELTAQQVEKCHGLMVIKDKLIENMHNKLGLVSSRARQGKRYNNDAYSNGYTDGKAVNLGFKNTLR